MMPADRRAVWISSFVATLIQFGSAGAALSQENAESVDEYVRTQMAERRIPGMALAVIRKGRIEKIGVYGKASIEFDLPVTTSTSFAVASISKSVTAVAILTLVEAGKLRLDDRVSSHLRDLPQAWQSVTVRQLLNHTSGLPDVNVNDYTTATIANTPAEALRLLRDRPIDFVPGANYRYNQTNYMLLGMLIERLSGLPYSQFVTDRLFKRLNLQNAVFGDARAVVMRRATTYTQYRYDNARPEQTSGAEVLNAEMATMMYPAGGLNISIDDFARWLAALLNGAIVSKESLDTIWAPTKLNDGTIYQRPATPSLWRGYGLGWVSRLDGRHPFVGGTGGIRAAFFVYPNDDLAVIVLTNWQGAQPESLVDGIARKFL
jgi:CubicO group peptidase (beta-lactamase class C family)